MRHTDVALVGGGLAGSTCAAMLGRAGVDAVLIDPHEAYPPDFRCEKLDGSQVRLFRDTGLADPVLRAATPDDEIWIARFGHLVEKRPNNQFGMLYQDLVNGVRAEIPQRVPLIVAKATALATSADRQIVTLSTGEEISARLIVLANGLNVGLRDKLGMTREVLSANHSISIGFDIVPVGRPRFDFPALTSFPDRVADRMAYVTFFPIGGTMRANLFVYRDMADPWLRQMRKEPEAALLTLQPSLRKLLGAFEIPQPVRDPAGRSLCHPWPPAGRRRAGRRCVRDVVPGGRHRLQQGVHRRRAALPRPHSALARRSRHGRGEDRGVLR